MNNVLLSTLTFGEHSFFPGTHIYHEVKNEALAFVLNYMLFIYMRNGSTATKEGHDPDNQRATSY